MWIQLVVTMFSIFVVYRLFVNYREKKLPKVAFFFWLVVWVSIIVIFWSPDLASRIALIFGIGRGADLIVYVSIIVIFYLLYRLGITLEKIQKNITVLSRSLALHDDERKKNSSSDTDPKL